MTSIRTYENFLIKANKNDTNKNVNISKGLFVRVFNEQSKIWLNDRIENKSTTDEKNQISELLVVDKKLEKHEDHLHYSSFKLPVDYFDYATSYSLASRGSCKDRLLVNWDFKIKNRNNLYQDNNNNPSFDYEETIINFASAEILVFKTDFIVDSQFLTYYKQPIDIDIEGYTNEDGTKSTNVNPDLSDYNVNQILNLCVLETIRIYENPDGYQLAKERLLEQ